MGLNLNMFQHYIPATYIRFACFSTLGLVNKVTLRGSKIGGLPSIRVTVRGPELLEKNNSKTNPEKIETIFPSFKTFSKVLQTFSDDL
jgi:hypothetical protein